MKHEGIIVKCSEQGKITIHQDHENEEFSEIVCRASTITKLYRILVITSKEIWKDDPTWLGGTDYYSFSLNHQGIDIASDEKGKIIMHKDHDADDTFSEIVCDSSFIVKVYRMLAASRKLEWRDEPFIKSDDTEEIHEEE